MSVVTGIMLMLGVSDWDESSIAEVQEWLGERDWPALADVSNQVIGGKHPQYEAWAAGINGFVDHDEFIRFVLGRNWICPGQIALIVTHEPNDSLCVYRPEGFNVDAPPR